MISVIIPAYNEEHRILPTLNAVVCTLRTTNIPFEVLVVDDGSTDQTVEVVTELQWSMPEIRILGNKENRGKGAVVRQCMLAARGSVCAMLDADGSISPQELLKILSHVQNGADIAIGSRYVGESCVSITQPWYRRAWSRIANAAVQKLLVGGIQDTQCGAKVFTRQSAQILFRHATIDGWAFDLEILALARRLGYSIKEVGVHWEDDPRSRISPLKDLCRVVKETAQIRFRVRKQTRKARLLLSGTTS